MATLDELQTRRDDLVKRRESLTRRVQTGDRTVEYDLDQVKDALAELDRQIAQQQGGRRTRRIHLLSRKGWLA